LFLFLRKSVTLTFEHVDVGAHSDFDSFFYEGHDVSLPRPVRKVGPNGLFTISYRLPPAP
jgi:hypothetical protein